LFYQYAAMHFTARIYVFIVNAVILVRLMTLLR
jgi:hypothetical protein